MIMFERLVLEEEKAKAFQGKTVEYACKTMMTNPMFGRFPSWRGTLSDSFFTIVFVGGLLEVSVAEREFYLVIFGSLQLLPNLTH